MATTSKPEEQQTTSTPPTTPTVPPSTEPPTTPPVTPPVVPDNREVMALYDQVLREREQENQRLRAQLEEKTSAPPPKTPEEERQRFYNDPREVIREEIRASVEPLLQFVKGFRTSNAVDSMKTRYRNDPRYSAIFPKIENHLDRILSSMPGEITEQDFQAAVLSTIGAAAAGLIPGVNLSTPAAPPPSTSPTTVTPPYIPPSAPPAPAPAATGPKRRDLTELEKRLARERGMTEDEYFNLLDLSASKVANAQGRK